MQSPIRQGDKLEHGGQVTGGSPWFEVMGRPLARKGDEAICEQHGPTTIDEGYARFPDRDGMDLFAKQQVRVASESADIQLAAKTKIALNSGGASLEIEGGNMTFHCPGAFTIKAGSFTFVGPENVPTRLPSLPKSNLKVSDTYSSSH